MKKNISSYNKTVVFLRANKGLIEKIFSWGIISLGILAAILTLFFHIGFIYYWYAFFAIVVGLTLLPLSEEQKK